MARHGLLLLLAGCFSPQVEEGALCAPDRRCPPGQTCADDGHCYADPPGFRFRRRIDIHPLTLGNVQRDFPLAVIIEADEGLAAHARDDGLDLHFTEPDATTLLDFEIEAFDGETGRLVAWVRVPLLSFEDSVYLHYGGEPIDRPDPAAVWGERYLAVWHGEDAADPLALHDSTGNRNHGSSGDGQAPERVAGIAGTALSFDGIDDLVVLPGTLVALDPARSYLVTMWVRVDEPVGDRDAAMGQGIQSGTTAGFGIQLGAGPWEVRMRGAGTSETQVASFGDASLFRGRWVMLGTQVRSEEIGQPYFAVDARVDGMIASSGYWYCEVPPCDVEFGESLFLSHPEARFKGLIDEIRIVDQMVGGENERVQQENLADPETFYTVGAEETLPL
jgi:hypothetical protein